MKLYLSLAALVILLGGCGGTVQTKPPVSVANNPGAGSPTPKAAISPIPDDSGLILQCLQCAFLEEPAGRFIAGQIHNDAKQAVSGYVLAIDLQDGKGNSVKKIDGLMLMKVMSLQAGETQEFKERILSKEANVTQATVYFKKPGKDVKLSNTVTLKLNAHPANPAPSPTKAHTPPQL